MSRYLLLLAIVLAVASVAAAQDVGETGYVSTPDGERLFYEKVGRGPDVLILPARLFTVTDFRRLGEHHTLIAYDMRNRGRSDFVADDAKISIEADVEDLETIRRHFGVEKFTPVGYSYLGLMVVLYAMQYPQHVERIIQVGPVPLHFGAEYDPRYVAADSDTAIDPQRRQRLRELRTQNFHLTHPRQYCEEEWTVTRPNLVGDPAFVDRLPSAAEICSMPNEWPTNLVRHLRLHFEESVLKLNIPREQIKQIAVPVLTIHGTRDRNAPYGAGREWAFLLPNARLLTVEGAAHHVFAERPEIVLPAIETFLAGQWPPASEQVTTEPRKRN